MFFCALINAYVLCTIYQQFIELGGRGKKSMMTYSIAIEQLSIFIIFSILKTSSIRMVADGHELRTAGLEKPVKVTIGQPSGDQNSA